MIINLVPNLKKIRSLTVTKSITETLCSLGAKVVMSNELQSTFSDLEIEFLAKDEAFLCADAIITIGGDGTILHTAMECLNYNKPLLGVNIGRLGFLATAEAEEKDKLNRLVNKDFVLDKRALLTAEINGKKQMTKLALNDFVVIKSSPMQMVDVKIYCDNVPVNSYRGDGVVLATPTGSTAYSLSAGGPILDAKTDGILVTPICAHGIKNPSMIFSSSRQIKVEVASQTIGDVLFCADGTQPYKLGKKDIINIGVSQKSISLISFSETDQFEAIDKKLKGR